MNRFSTLIDDLSQHSKLPSLAVATQTTQQQRLKSARAEAQMRVQRAHLRLNGIHDPMYGQRWQQEGLRKARALIDRSITNIDEVVDVLYRMQTVISADRRFTTQHDPAYCGTWGAYYDSRDSLIHTCPAFFNLTAEEQIRTVIHEAAHAVGIGQSQGESYLMFYDCTTSFDDKNVADGWAHFIHCVLELPTDRPNTVRGNPSGGNGASAQSIARAQQASCPQMSEARVGDDVFVLDILQYFFGQRLRTDELNDDLREIAARMLWAATQASRQMDLVPRPPRGVPSITWLVSEAVQIAFRRANNRCIYQAVKVTVARNFRSAYEIARATGGSRGSRGLSMAYGAVNYTVPGIVPAIAQPSSMACWATVYTMLYSWQRQTSFSIEDALSDLGTHWLNRYRNNTGLPGSEKQTFVNAAGLVAEPPMNPSLEDWEQMLRQYGPIWLTTNERPDVGWAIHARVLVGIHGDGTPTGTKFKIIDPAGGRQYEESIATFLPKYEDEVRRTGYTRIQILHWPANASGAQSFSNGYSLEFEAPYAQDFQVAIDWCQIRHNIIRSAVEIQGDWLSSGNNLMNESNPAVLTMLTMFWRDGVGMSATRAATTAAASAADRTPWSAAFISWCVRNALPTPPPPHNGGFQFGQRHMIYIAHALRNRENSDQTRPFWLFDINDPNVVPEDGDILCLNRPVNSVWTRHSYQSVRQRWVVDHPNVAAPTGSSHCDIVIGHFNQNGRRWIETIGGNVSNTVGSRYYSLNANGRLDDRVTLNGTAIANKTNVTQTVGNRPPIVFGLIRLTACPNFS